MTVQEAAFEILKEKGHPLSPKEIVKIVRVRGMVPSNAKDPEFSLASTLTKNIRDNKYNSPKLSFMRSFKKHERGERLIGLPEWVGENSVVTPLPRTKTVEISAKVADMLELARLAGLGNSETEVIDHLVREGFKTVKGEIEAKLVNKVKQA